MRPINLTFLALASSFIGLLSCTRDKAEGAPSNATVTAANARLTAVTIDDAANDIVVARCAREAACAKIRGRRVTTTSTECHDQLAPRVSQDLDGRACRGGVARDALDDCLGEIGAEDCDGPFVPVKGVLACRAERLCPTSVL